MVKRKEPPYSSSIRFFWVLSPDPFSILKNRLIFFIGELSSPLESDSSSTAAISSLSSLRLTFASLIGLFPIKERTTQEIDPWSLFLVRGPHEGARLPGTRHTGWWGFCHAHEGGDYGSSLPGIERPCNRLGWQVAAAACPSPPPRL